MWICLQLSGVRGVDNGGVNGIYNQHSNIIFTSNISTTSVYFLDVTIDLHGGHISTKTYTRSTDIHAFLSYNSFHPRHIKQSIIYSQFLRYKRICSDDILHNFSKVKQIDRHKLLSNTPKQQHSNICRITKGVKGICNQHSNIIFTSNISIKSVNFLDVTIDLHGGHISTKTYTKLTDIHAFLS